MRSYLVVANQTLGGSHLLDKVAECMKAGPCRFHILVPATPPQDHLTYTEGEAESIANSRLEAALERFKQMGAEADGSTGDPSPLQAITDVLERLQVDEILLSTLPPGVSKWLGQDLPHRVERTFNLPVTHLVGAPET